MRIQDSIRLLLAVVLLANLVAAQSSLGTSDNHNARRPGAMFDIVATNAVVIDDFDVNLIPAVPALDVEVYAVTGGGSFFGVEQNPAAWTLIGRATHVRSLNTSQAAPGLFTALGLSLAYPVPAGATQGFYITVAGNTAPANSFAVQARFDNGFLDPDAANADITILRGLSNEFSGGMPFGTTVPLTPIPGQVCSAFSGRVHYRPLSGQSGDLMLANVLAPTGGSVDSCDPLTSSESVTVRVLNAGSTALASGSTLDLSYVLNGAMPVIESITLTSPLPPTTSFDHTFAVAADLSAIALHDLAASVALTSSADPVVANDSIAVVVSSGGAAPVTTFPWLETFDGAAFLNTQEPPVGWLQERDDAGGQLGAGGDWFFSNTDENPFGSGPPSDRTTGIAGQGFFAFVEDSGSFPDIGLRTPCIDLSSLADPLLRFFYYSENPNTPSLDNTLHVDVISHPGPVVTTDVIAPIGHTGPGWQCATVSLAAFSGVVQVRFRGNTDSGGAIHDLAIDDVMIGENLPVDASVRSIDAPASNTASCEPLGMTPVTVTIGNEGTAPIAGGTSLQVSYRIDGGPYVDETLVLGGPLLPCEAVSFTFATLADLSAVATFILEAQVALAGDPNALNDTATASVQSAVTPLPVPFFEDFDGVATLDTVPPPGWVQDANDGGGSGNDTDWIFRDSPTPSSNTGPPSDHTTGAGLYAYVEDSNNEHPAVNLLTPCLDLSGTFSPLLSYFVYSLNGQSTPTSFENFLHVDVITFPGGVVNLDVAPPVGHLGAGWMQQFVDLSSFVGQTVQVRFRGRSDGGSFRHDMAIDDVSVDNSGNLGTLEDLALATLVNQTGVATELNKSAAAGDALLIGIESPGATFDGIPPIVAGEIFLDGAEPPAGLLLPELHITFSAFALLNAPSSVFGPVALGPGGIVFGFVIPAGLDAFGVRIQGWVTSPLAVNGIYATTNAHDVDLTN